MYSEPFGKSFIHSAPAVPVVCAPGPFSSSHDLVMVQSQLTLFSTKETDRQKLLSAVKVRPLVTKEPKENLKEFAEKSTESKAGRCWS